MPGSATELAGPITTLARNGRSLMTYNSQFEKWVAALTPNVVNSAMKKHIDQSKITIVKAGDFKNHPPKSPSVVP